MAEESPTPHKIKSIVVALRSLDFELGEVPRTSNNRYNHSLGPVSPYYSRNVDDPHMPDFDTSTNHKFYNSSGSQRGRGFVGRRSLVDERVPGRCRYSSPLYGRGKGTHRYSERHPHIQGFGHGSFKNDGRIKGSAKLAPGEENWIHPNRRSRRKNFYRQSYCNKYNNSRLRTAILGHKLREGIKDYLNPPSGGCGRDRAKNVRADRSYSMHRKKLPDQDMQRERRDYSEKEHIGRRFCRHVTRLGKDDLRCIRVEKKEHVNLHRGGWRRDSAQEVRADQSHIWRGGRFPGQDRQRERRDYPEKEHKRRRFERQAPRDRKRRDGEGDSFNRRRGYDANNRRRPVSPPTPPSHSRVTTYARSRSRSPRRGVPAKDRRDIFKDRGRGPTLYDKRPLH